jgi:hypothetical protein
VARHIIEKQGTRNHVHLLARLAGLEIYIESAIGIKFDKWHTMFSNRTGRTITE